jgi:hypothetical protein
MKRKLNSLPRHRIMRAALLALLILLPVFVFRWVFATGPEPYLVKNIYPAFDSNPQNLTSGWIGTGMSINGQKQ